MERLTVKHSGVKELKGFVNVGSDEICENHICEKCPIQKAIDKLAEYEDAEEQGLLIRLPVAEGSTVYVLNYIYECKYNYECVLKYDEYICEEGDKCRHEKKIWRVEEAVFNYRMFESIGKTAFLTREEAEAALERMG